MEEIKIFPPKSIKELTPEFFQEYIHRILGPASEEMGVYALTVTGNIWSTEPDIALYSFHLYMENDQIKCQLKAQHKDGHEFLIHTIDVPH